MIVKDEAFWHGKHPRVSQVYRGRPLPRGGSYEMDVRHFVWADDVVLQGVARDIGIKTEEARMWPDVAALRAQEYVTATLDYQRDATMGATEYWLFPAETLAQRSGDCEDGAILMASLLLNVLAPVDRWRVRVSAGIVTDVDGTSGGHAYVTYCRATDNEWVILDWCYQADPSVAVADKPLAKTVPAYREVWFSFNHLYAWSERSFELFKRMRGYESRKGRVE